MGKWKQLGRGIYLALAVGISALVVRANLCLWTVSAASYPYGQVGEDVLWQLHHIKGRLIAGEGEQMQALFPEGWFFSHIVYGNSWINVALSTKSAALRQQAIQEVRWVLEQADSPQGRAPFTSDTQVRYGVFYLGWTNRLLGGLLKIQHPKERAPQDVARFHAQSSELARAFAASPTATLDAYPGQAWPCDQTVALASLALHDELFGSNYRRTIEKWIDYTQEHLDPQTGLIPHKIDAATGEIEIGARGSSQVYLLAFLPELDPAFATQQYARFRQQFAIEVIGFLPIREYPLQADGQGDVDSGPIIFGIGPTSTIVSIAPARAHRDAQVFESTLLLAEIFGFPQVKGQEKSYAFGWLLVIDDFLVWGKSLVPWTEVNYPPYSTPTMELKRWFWHLSSGALLLLIWSPLIGKVLRFGRLKLNRSPKPRLPVDRDENS
ncbi:MAG: hypothetical protein KME17_04080 [Cyanosarcina radialis HA8281-LM2]|jgi:hypothetical protein|nr:hypothetical protein [Cyanosarcina radialis HA8281-LM2]